MKYRLTDETIEWCGHTLHRIEALIDFNDVKVGDKGGWIESENNLSQEGTCWVYNSAKVFDSAAVYDFAKVCVYATVYGYAKVCGDAAVYGYAKVCGDAVVKSSKDYIVFKNWWSSCRYFTWTRSNNMWKVGCFYGSGEKLIAKAYQDSEVSGREYERVVKYVESILNDKK